MQEFLKGCVVVLALGCCLGCSDASEERPPLVEGGGSGVSGGGPSGGGGGASGDGDSDGPTGDGTTLAGEVESYLDDDFILTSVYGEPATVFLFEVGSSERIETEYDGTSFSTDVQSESRYWAQVRPSFDTATFPTVSLLEVATTSTELPVLRRSIVEEMLGGLTSPVVVNDGRAQVIVQVVDSSGDPIEGVTPTAPGATDIAYQDGGLWRDNLDETTESGTFIAYNVSVRGSPGEDLPMILAGSVDEEQPIRAIAGSVTFVRLTVD